MRAPSPFGAVRRDARKGTRWLVLDGIRGAAICGVVLYHIYRLLIGGIGDDVAGATPSPWWWVLGVGKFTIDVFFVLSGFLVVLSWESLRRKASTSGEALRGFFRRRLRRVLPAWWLSLAILVPLVAPDLLTTAAGVRHLALFVTVQQYLVPGLAPQVNTVSWSLTTELHFYLLVPVIALLLRRLGRWPLLVLAYGVSLLWWLRLSAGLSPSLLPGRIDQFVAGIVAATLVTAHERGETHRVVRWTHARFLPFVLITIVTLLGIHHGSTFGITDGTVLDALLHPIVGFCVAVLLVRLLTASGAGRSPVRAWLERPGLRAAGLVSYSAYIWHYPLLLWLVRTSGLAGHGADHPVASAVLAAGFLAALALIATTSYALVERPFLAHPPPTPVCAAASDTSISKTAAQTAGAGV